MARHGVPAAPVVAQLSVTSELPINFVAGNTHTMVVAALAVDPETGSTDLVISGRSQSWGSGTPAVATVSGTGVVTAVAAGATTISCVSEGMTISQGYTVSSSQPLPVSVTVLPVSGAGVIGQTLALQARVWDGAGGTGNVLLNISGTWSSATPAIATVADAGGDPVHLATVTCVALGGPVNITFTTS